MSNESLRDYLERNHVAPLLEQLVVDIGEARPENIFVFVEDWARSKRQGNAAAATGGGKSMTVSPSMVETREGSASEKHVLQAREVWSSLSDKGGLVDKFWTILFTQHASLKRKMFADVDIDAVKPLFVEYLNGCVMGTLPIDQLRTLAAEHGTGRGAELKHFHYFLTAMLSALSMTLSRDVYQQHAETFRVMLTSVGEELMIGMGIKEKSGRDDMERTVGAQISDQEKVQGMLRKQWECVENPLAAAELFFKILFTQHGTLKKTIFADYEDVSQLYGPLLQYFTQCVSGDLSEKQVEALVTEKVPDDVDDRHFQYFLTAGLLTLRGVVPDFKEHNSEWTQFIGRVCASMSVGLEKKRNPEAAAPASPEDDEDAERNKAYTFDEAAAIVRDSWTGIADKPAFIKRFYTVLLTQHSTLGRTLFRDIELEAVAGTFETLLGKAIMGEMSDAELKALGEAHGKPRNAELKHFHYFLSSMLIAVRYTVGDVFPKVAEPYRIVLTSIGDKLAAGCVEETKEAAE